MPEEWLEADIKQGLTNEQVEERRRRYGFNEISTEKENLFIKFLMFFTGPILYGKSFPLFRTHPVTTKRVLRVQWLVARVLLFPRAAPVAGSYGRKKLGFVGSTR